jgi:hypothetical protein
VKEARSGCRKGMGLELNADPEGLELNALEVVIGTVIRVDRMSVLEMQSSEMERTNIYCFLQFKAGGSGMSRG